MIRSSATSRACCASRRSTCPPGSMFSCARGGAHRRCRRSPASTLPSMRLSPKRRCGCLCPVNTATAGLLALSGISGDMRALLESDRPEAQEAVEHYCYWAARHAGSLAVALEGVDALVFTGGIGENAARVRAGILDRLRWFAISYDKVR